MSLLLLVGSVLGVLGLAAASWLMGLGGGTQLDRGVVMREAEAALAGFEAEDAFVSSDGSAALVIGAGRQIALVKQHGTQVAVRLLDARSALSSLPDGFRIESGERMFGAVTLRLAGADRDKLLALL
jgi:hypothetical protein